MGKKFKLVLLVFLFGALSLYADKPIATKEKDILVKKDAIKLARWKRSGSIVTDTKLGLMWQDDSAAKNTKKNWKDAKIYCQNLSLAGFSDWRLPTYNELLSIVDYDRYNPAIMPSFKNVSNNGYYWSSSVFVKNSKFAWYVCYKDGLTYRHDKHADNSVRCIRGGN